MSEEDRDAIGHYKAVARGWWFVGAGAWFIFLKEACELASTRSGRATAYWVMVVLMTHGRARRCGRGR